MDTSGHMTAAERVGSNVRRIRQNCGWTLDYVSRRLSEKNYKIGVATLSKIERGDRRIAVDDLEALATALDVSSADLLASTDEGLIAGVVGMLGVYERMQWRLNSGPTEIEMKKAELDDLEAELRECEETSQAMITEINKLCHEHPRIVKDAQPEHRTVIRMIMNRKKST